MPIEDPTFGCGTYLPGMGPGNLPEFVGGGYIDGGDGPPPPPPGGGGFSRPRPKIPTSGGGSPPVIRYPDECLCVYRGPPSIQSSFPKNNQILHTATFKGTCEKYTEPVDDVVKDFAADKEGSWTEASTVSEENKCKSKSLWGLGESKCTGHCPIIKVKWFTHYDPGTPTTGQGGPGSPSPHQSECYCVYPESPSSKTSTPYTDGSIKYKAVFIGICQASTAGSPPDYFGAWVEGYEPEDGMSASKMRLTEGSVSNGCKKTLGQCAGECSEKYVEWFEYTTPPPTSTGPTSPSPGSPTPPTGIGPVPKCYCIYTQTDYFEGPHNDGGTLHTAIFTGECKKQISEPVDIVQALADQKQGQVSGGIGNNCKSDFYPSQGSQKCTGYCKRKTVTWITGNTTPPGGGSGPGDPKYTDREIPINPEGAGSNILSKGSNTEAAIFGNAASTGLLDLTNPAIASNVLNRNPTGLQEPGIAFITTPQDPTEVVNKTGYTTIFADTIDSNVSYVLKNLRNVGSWDSTRAAGVTPESVYFSLRSDIKTLFDNIRNYDGTKLTINQIYNMVGTRILDGSIADVTLGGLQKLAASSKKRVPFKIKRSSSIIVNEVAATALIDKNKFTLDPSKTDGRMTNILPNWKTLATDIDQSIPIRIAGVSEKIYVRDDNTFMETSGIKIQDGNYINIAIGGVTQRLFTNSELDHAFILPENIRQQTLGLLGGYTGRTLEVSASPSLSGIEFDYSLTAPRQNFYVLSAVLSSINTVPNPMGSLLLKDSTTQYDLVDTSSASGLTEFNKFIKYKANHRVFMLDDEDLIFDYLDVVGNLTITQTDILFDSPKSNKSIPLLTRQIYPYILIYPTNRSDYNLFNDKSQLISIGSDGATARHLRCRTTIVPEFSKDQTNKFVRIMTDGKAAVDVLGNANTQIRITQIEPQDTVFTTGYRDGYNFLAADTYTRTRRKTGFRLVKEIITELATNYFVEEVGRVKSITEFDVFSRLYLSEFNRLSRLENFISIRDAIRNGLVEGVRVIPPIARSSNDISFRNTMLVRRRAGAPADVFTSIKGTRDREIVVSPTTDGGATRGSVPTRGTR